MAKITIEDLKRIKEKASHTVALRTGEASVTVTIHMGECGIKAGAREVMKNMLDAKTAAERPDIKVVAGECIGRCSTEPNVTVEVKGSSPAVYQNMDLKRANQVFSQHVMGGEVQTELLLQDE